ncbi:MAG: hypothetical protein QM791_13105 [Ferruginibacter sp.]
MMQLIKPYSDESLNIIYNQLFCDIPSLYNSGADIKSYPWSILFAEDNTGQALLGVAEDKKLESRLRLLAYNEIRSKGLPAGDRELLAVIIEVGLEGGLDVLAAFHDGTARYINQSEKLVVWETQTEASQNCIRDLFAESIKVVSKIGPWDKERLPPPSNGNIRLNFLVSDGLYFGSGPFDVLARDAMGGPVIQAATALMTYLTGKVHT